MKRQNRPAFHGVARGSITTASDWYRERPSSFVNADAVEAWSVRRREKASTMSLSTNQPAIGTEVSDEPLFVTSNLA
jgi:hypothetical protein